MDIINNRYKIVREVSYNTKDISAFLALDFYNESKLVGLTILPQEKLSFYSKNFIKANFNKIISMPNNFFFSNYDFKSTVAEVNGVDQKIFYFTYAAQESYNRVSDYLDLFTLEDILMIIVKICQCQNLAIINGFLQPIASMDDFFILKDKNKKFHLKADNLISIVCTIKNADEKYNFESIAELFLSLLKGYSKNRSFYDNINEVQKAYLNINLDDYTKKILDCILSICESIIEGKYGASVFDFYYLLIADINKKLNAFFELDDTDPKSYFCVTPKIPNREENIDTIINEIIGKDKKINKNIFLITGNLGSGKSRFLNKFSFDLNFEDVDFYFFTATKNSHTFFIQLLSQMINNYPNLKNEIDLNNIYIQIKDFNLGKTNLIESKYSLIKKINNIIKECQETKPQVFIIDNFNLIDKFTLEFIFSNISQTLTESNLYYVFSFSKDFSNTNTFFKVAYKKIFKFAHEINLKSLTQFETAVLIKNILVTRTEPIITAKEINKVTGGNPYFIIELVQQLILKKEIWKNKVDGHWEINSDIYSVSHFFKLPESIFKLAKKTFSKYFEVEYESLKVISVFQVYIKKSFIKKLIPELTDKKVEQVFSKLLEDNFISKYKDDIFRIDEKILQSSLYSLLEEDEKKDLHIKALKIVQAETENIFVDELLIHYDFLGYKNKALDLLIKKGDFEKSNGDLHEAVINYERALTFLKKHPLEKQVEIATTLALIYCDIGKLTPALQTLMSLESFLPTLENKNIEVNYYLAYCEVLFESYDFTSFKIQFEKLKQIVIRATNLNDDQNLNIKKTFVMANMLQGDFSLAEINLNSLILEDLHGTQNKILTDIYRYFGKIKLQQNDFKGAKNFYLLSYKNAQKYKNIKKMLGGLNNIAGILFFYESKFSQAEKAYIKALDLAKRTGFEQIALLCLINLTMLYMEIDQLNKAEKYLNLANEKLISIMHSINLQMHAQVLKYLILIRKCQYRKSIVAKQNFESTLKKVENTNLAEKFIYNFYDYNANINLTFGDYNSCIKNLKSVLNKNIKPIQEKIISFKIMLVEVLYKEEFSTLKLNRMFLSLLKTLPKNNIRDLLYESINVVFHSIACSKFYLFKSFAEVLLKKAEKIFDNAILSKIKLKTIQTLLSEKINEKTWISLLAELNSQNIIGIEIVLKTQLALAFYTNQKYAQGILVFIDVQKLIFQILQKVPHEKWLSFFNLYSFKVPFKIPNDFIKKGATKINDNIFLEKISETDLKKLSNINYLKRLTRNEDFLEILLCEVFYADDWILKYRTLMETLENFTDNYENNIHLLINLMMQKLFASYANILITDFEGCKRFLFDTKNENSSLSDYVLALKNSDLSVIEKQLDDLNMQLIILPLQNNYNQNKYKLIFVVQKQVAILSRRRIKYCKKILPIMYNLLKAYTLEHNATKDKYSGASNIEHFKNVLKSCVNYSTTERIGICLCYFKIENLKVIGKFYGSNLQSKIIKAIVELVYANIRHKDILARYTTDEFVILFYNTNKNDVVSKLDFIQNQVSNLNFKNLSLPLSITAGVANLDEQGVTLENIVDKAYIAMLYASTQGVNKTFLYYPSFENSSNILSNISELYSKNISFSQAKVKVFFDLFFTASKYASKSTMLDEFLYKILDYMDVTNVSLIFMDKNKNELNEKILTVGEQNNENINWQYIKQAKESLTGFFTDDVQMHQLDDLNFPTWYSVLVYPISDGSIVKGVLYITAQSNKKCFSKSDLTFINIVSILLEKEL